MSSRVQKDRIRLLQPGDSDKGPIIYWMSRDQRIEDNWALLFAQDMALKNSSFVFIVFCLANTYLEATLRQYDFMLQGLRHTAHESKKYNIPFFVLPGQPEQRLPGFLHEQGASCLVKDFDPLRLKRHWTEEVISTINIPVFEVDTHNIVPCWYVSDKQEFAARTFRPKIEKSLPDFLEPFPELLPQPSGCLDGYQEPDWHRLWEGLEIDCSVQPVSWLVSGSKAGLQRLSEFLDKTLAHYENTRNDPNAKGLSHLSPYLHFGQIAPQRVALETMQVTEEIGEQKRAFLEELVVRRELADNFCFYNALYDSFEGLPRWAKESLDKHKKVPRDPLYSYEDFEFSRTHDPLWNAAQTQMRHSGKMHGYLRMYWAKKVLEWTVSPEEAIAWAIQLNDTYELDGRDPNGYTGVLWSIGGLHDRPFKERPIFGKVRYMSYKGCQRKFDVNLFIAQWGSEQQ